MTIPIIEDKDVMSWNRGQFHNCISTILSKYECHILNVHWQDKAQAMYCCTVKICHCDTDTIFELSQTVSYKVIRNIMDGFDVIENCERFTILAGLYRVQAHFEIEDLVTGKIKKVGDFRK